MLFDGSDERCSLLFLTHHSEMSCGSDRRACVRCGGGEMAADVRGMGRRDRGDMAVGVGGGAACAGQEQNTHVGGSRLRSTRVDVGRAAQRAVAWDGGFMIAEAPSAVRTAG